MKHTLRCHGFGERAASRSVGRRNRCTPLTKHDAKTAPALKGLRPEPPLALSLGSPIREVLPSPRFALSTILTR